MIQKIRRFLGIESLEEASIEYSSLLEEASILKSELDVIAREYISTNHHFDTYLNQEKSEESLDLMKSQRDQFTSRYLQRLVEKKKEFEKLESDKTVLLKKYPDLEKAVIEFSKLEVVEKLLKSYREGRINLQDSNLLIKAVTKKKVMYSDNIVFNQDGEMLILERADGEGDDRKITWSVPGGHVEEGEEHKAGAIRELLEETGYTVDDCYLVGEYEDDVAHIQYFTSIVDTNDQTATIEADEVQYYEFIPVGKLYDYTPFHPNMWDNIYLILGISKEIVKIKKAIEEGYVKEGLIEEGVFSKGGKTTTKKKFNKVMKEYGEGTLHSGGDDKTVTDHKQALAIAFSESEKSFEDEMKKALEDEFKETFQTIYKKLYDKDTIAQVNEILKGKKKEVLPGGVADKKTLEEIAKKHKVELKDIESEFEMGKKVEKEHTKEEDKIEEITKDHLWESATYYTDLKKVEKGFGEDEFEKAKQLGHLIPKKVQIKGKDGKIHMAIRWVNPNTGEGEKLAEGLKESKKIEGVTFEESVEKIVASDIPKSDKVRNLIDLGIYDISLLALLTGEPTPQYFLKQSDIDIKELPDNSGTIKAEILKEQADNDTPEEREGNTLLREIPIEELWDNYERNLKRVIQGRHKFTVAYGTGGVGKTFVFRQLTKKFELREFDDEIQPSKDQYDFVVVSGKITPTQVYAEMYRHRDKLIVFDDCDSFLSTEEVQGFLKAGLDTGETSKISNKSSKKVYNIEGDPESGTIPNTFSFKGRVIAITNLVSRQLDQAVKSRAMCSNLTMTVEETIEKLGTIKNKIDILTADKSSIIPVTQEARDYAFEVLKDHKAKLGGDINTRTYSNAVLIAYDAFEEGIPEEKVRREIIAYFDSVTGSFDEMVRQQKGKGK